MMTEQFLTVQEAAIRLRLHPFTIRRQLRSGSLRGFKRGKLWRVPESALSEQTGKSVGSSPPAESPLLRALALVRERDARAGNVAVRRNGDAAADVRAVREARTP